MHILLKRGAVFQKGDELYDCSDGTWYSPRDIEGQVYQGLSPARRKLHLLDIHLCLNKCVELSFVKGVESLRLSKSKHKNEEEYDKFANGLAYELKKFVELLPYE